MNAAGDVSPRTVDITTLLRHRHDELLAVAVALGIEVRPHTAHDELVAAIASQHLQNDDQVHTEGVLAVLPEGFGFVRMLACDFASSAVDAYVSPAQVRSLNLKDGHRLRGPIRAPKGTERFFALTHVEQVQGVPTDALPATTPFADRTALLPQRPLTLPADDEGRTLQALAPWCYGHRVLVTAPTTWPRARLLARIAAGLHQCDPKLRSIACLLDHRPEDRAAVHDGLTGIANCDIVGSMFAEPPERHVTVATMALATARRMTEQGSDVVLLVDSLTALVRAASRSGAPSGAWARPGLDARALQVGKQLFASARQCQQGGSLTVLATLAIAPDSPLDQDIADEFAASTNSSVVIDPTLAANEADLPFDLAQTRTRPEDDPRPATERQRWRSIRAQLVTLPPAERHQQWLAAVHSNFDSLRPTS